ncbi:GNAT family N-acetyltransferase [Oscillospiraceae bacterium MB08-C2-2]|nr:GNAT family N-acetyltransferase [Oscillospiraceae bacterium MB08-C2-2]
MNELRLRVASPDDAKELLEIYTPYVKNTAITFEYEVPSVGVFEARIQNTLKKYPYLVAEKDGEILGYAYTGAFVGRAAYAWGAELTIYLKQNKKKMGLGKKLYHALERVSVAQNILNLNACIGYPEVEDEYLNQNSAQFHEHLGYALVGRFHKCGYKFGRWYDMIWMEKLLGEHSADPAPVISFPDLSPEVLHALGIE